MALQKLPFEVLHCVADFLGIDDIFSLSLSCKQFQNLIRSNSVCKSALLVSPPGQHQHVLHLHVPENP